MSLIVFRRLVTAAVLASFLVITPAAAVIAQEQAPEPIDPPDPAEVDRREMLVVDGTGEALDSGGSETLFSVELEGEDECPGDSAHDQYRVDSYMVPVDVDPTQLVYTAFGPTPIEFQNYEDFQMPLQKASKNPFAAELTDQQIEPGAPGPIREIPLFDFAVYVETPGIDGYEGGLPSGEYRIGLACTFANRISNLWETTIEVTQDAGDELVGIAWTVTGPQPTDLETVESTSSGPVFVLLGVGVVLAVVAFVLHRSSKQSSGSGPSPSSRESTAWEA